MSAYDPKRTLGSQSASLLALREACSSRGAHATARVHQASRRQRRQRGRSRGARSSRRCLWSGFSASTDGYREAASVASKNRYVEGRNVAIEYRWAEVELIGYRRLRPIWFVVRCPYCRRQHSGGLRQRRRPRPFRSSSKWPDPVGLGLVAGLDRPGGNVTGVTNLA